MLQPTTSETTTAQPAIVRPVCDLDASLDPFDMSLEAHPSVFQLPVPQPAPRRSPRVRGKRTSRSAMVVAGALSFGVGFAFTLASMVLLLP